MSSGDVETLMVVQQYSKTRQNNQIVQGMR